jgi:hypothetical protein
LSDLGGVCAARAELFLIQFINCRLSITPIHNGGKPEDVTDGKEIPNVADIVTKAGGHDEHVRKNRMALRRGRVRGLGERRGADEHKVNYVFVGD